MNLDKLRLDRTAPARPAARPPRPAPKEHFVKGPIPMGWLRIVAEQVPHSMTVAIFIWQMAGMKNLAEFRLPTGKVADFGVDRFKFYRDLAALEGVGLIAVERHRGRHPIVKLLPAPPVKPEPEQGGAR